MSTKKQNKVDSVRQQWTQQRKGETPVREEAPASRGSHFAKPAGPASSIVFGENDEESALFSAASGVNPSGTHAAVSSVTVASAAVPAAPLATFESGTQGPMPAHRHLKIVGASGEMPAIPRRATKNPAALPYSRYNKRYLTESSSTPFSMAAFGEDDDPLGSPAYTWKPYLAYGLVCAVASIVWGLVTRFALSGSGVPIDGEASQTCGLVLLCAIVIGGVAMAVTTTVVTLQNNEDVSGGDAFASSLGKTMLMMLAGIAVWFLMMALVLFL